MSDLVYQQESYDIQGAIFEVYKTLGSGYLEAVYQECLAIEFSEQNIPYIAQPIMRISYKGNTLEQIYKPDFICFDKIIVELKAVSEILPEHKAQVLNYMKISEFKLGLLVNFAAVPKVKIQRFVL